MLYAYDVAGGKLRRLPPDGSLSQAVWIDLLTPLAAQTEAVKALGVDVPSLADMEEIEISNRLYHEGAADYMTVVLPGMTNAKVQTSAPVTFILTKDRLVTVRHHTPRPFETFPDRADKSGTGCASPSRLFLGLIEEIIGRLADLQEAATKSLDEVSREVFGGGAAQRPDVLQAALERSGREGEVLARVRLALLTLERALGFFTQASENDTSHGAGLKTPVKTHLRDIQALEVHADFLSSRVAHVTDATLGMVNLAQNATVRILSVVAALFLPPTLIASIYGMNFTHMPELTEPWGYPVSLALMVASSVATYVFFRWKKWL
jgi:magnesium transporter